jgi:transcriptional regulator with XRE-family HTH domain
MENTVKAKQGGSEELAAILNARLEEIGSYKSQKDVADEVGFPSANILSIIKRGATKLSLDRVEAMATALGLDLEVIMLPALRQYYTPEVIDALRKTFSSAETKTEREIISIARAHMDTKKNLSYETRQKLKEVFSDNKPLSGV